MFKRNAIKLDKTSKELFDIACNRVRKNKTDLQNLSHNCELEDRLYKEYAETNELHKIKNNTEQNISTDIASSLANLYKNHFAKDRSVLRYYYDSIMGSWSHTPKKNKCPYCGIGNLTELDHFLPESEFGLLSINPQNLIPSCHVCNKKKLNYYSNDKNKNLLHPYYDDVTTYQWLVCELEIIDKKTIPNFLCFNINNSIPPEVFQRMQFMFEYLNINQLKYQPYISDEISQLHYRFTDENGKYLNFSDDEIKIDLQETLNESNNIFGENHCKSAFYKSLLQLPTFNKLRPH